jgi:glycosyltransferase involved in cell wall biosynthesis
MVRDRSRIVARDTRLRVLHVVATGARRGGEVFASDLSRALADQDVLQNVVILRGDGDPAVDFSSPPIQLVRHSADTRPPAFNLRIARELRRAIADRRPDVVLAHGGESLKYAIPATAGRPIRVIYRRIGSIRGRTSLHGPRLLAYQILMRRASLVVAVADAIRDETIDRFRVPPPRVVTVPNAVDAARVRPAVGPYAVRASLGIPSTSPIVLSVGAFTWEKDPVATLAIAAGVVKARPEARFLMVGDGPMRRRIQTAVRDDGLAGRVLLAGARDDVADLLAASDVLMLNSRSEGMPGVLIEGGMLGLPAVASAVGGVPEVVEHGVTGLLARPGDRSTMISSVVDLIDDDVRRRAIGAAARDRCIRCFEIRGAADRYVEILEGRGGRP